MDKANYYEYIKNELISNEIYKRVKDYSKNRKDLETYYNVGKLILEAQGGEARAKYGNGLIKEYSKKLTSDIGKTYDTTTLKRMRQFYLLIQKGAPLVHQLTWSHYVMLLSINNQGAVNYYINECIKNNYSKRELQKIIKNRDFERLDSRTIVKLVNNKKTNIIDFVKNPIILKSNGKDIINEKILKEIVLEQLDDFLRELGEAFSYVGSEYKIQIGNTYNYIDILLYNYKYHSFVVIELKNTELKKDHVGQIEVYMNYVNKNIKSIDDNNTIGIIICKKNNKYVIDYCSDKRILSREYINK